METTRLEEREDYWYAPGLDGRVTIRLELEAKGSDMRSLEESAIRQLHDFVNGEGKPVISKIERGPARPEFDSMIGSVRNTISYEQQWAFHVFAPLKGVTDGQDFPSGEDD